MILQYVYGPVLNFLYDKITSKVNIVVRNYIIGICFFGIFCVQFLNLYGHHVMCSVSNDLRDLIIFFLMGSIILFSVNQKLFPLKWNKIIYIPFVFVGITVLGVGFLHKIGSSSRAFSLFVFMIVICLAYVWGNRRDYNTLFQLVTKAYLLFFALLFIYAILREPLFSREAYTIMDMNENGFAKLIAPATACSIYLFVLEDVRWKRIVYAAIAGISAYITVCTTCRAGILALIVIAIFYLILFYIRTGNLNKKYFKTSMLLLIIAVISICFTGLFLKYATPALAGENRFCHRLEYCGQKTTQAAEIAVRNQNKAEKAQIPGSYESYKQKTEQKIDNSKVLCKLDNVFSGRLVYWAMYFKKMSLTGTSKQLVPAGPHNQFIEFAYKVGIFTGIAWLFLLIAIGVLIVRGVIEKKSNWVYFVTLMYPVFAVIAMLDTGLFPLERGFIFLYYMSIVPLLVKRDDYEVPKNEISV